MHIDTVDRAKAVKIKFSAKCFQVRFSFLAKCFQVRFSFTANSFQVRFSFTANCFQLRFSEHFKENFFVNVSNTSFFSIYPI